MKRINFFKYAMFFVAAIGLVAFNSCTDDDDDNGEPPVFVEDGFYVKGDVTPFSELEFNGAFSGGINEVDQEPRATMYEKYVTLQAGESGFNIVQVAGAARTEWGPATVESVNLGGEREQPNITIQQGTLGTTGVFTVPENGLYHIILDTELNKFVIAPAGEWAYIGQATAWSDLPMTKSAFNINELSWSVEDLELRDGEFKLRYGGGWKLELSGDDVKVNTNFGGELTGSAPDFTLTLQPGGANYVVSEELEGLYDISLSWTVEDGFSAQLTRTGDLPELEFPEELYMTGAAVGDWSWEAGVYIELTKLDDGIFEATAEFTQDETFRFFAQPDWGPRSFNYPYFDNVDPLFENAEDGDSNFKFVGETGSFKVTVDFTTSTVSMESAK